MVQPNLYQQFEIHLRIDLSFYFSWEKQKEPDSCLVLSLAYSLNCATRFESSVARFSVSPIFA